MSPFPQLVDLGETVVKTTDTKIGTTGISDKFESKWQYYINNYRQPRQAESKRQPSLGKHSIWLSNTKLSALKTYMQDNFTY